MEFPPPRRSSLPPILFFLLATIPFGHAIHAQTFSQVGKWDVIPNSIWPNDADTAAALRGASGMALLRGAPINTNATRVIYWHQDDQGRILTYNPNLGAGESGSPMQVWPNHKIFCAGQSVLSDGSALVSGGYAAGIAGPSEASTFAPLTNAWSTPVSDTMRYPRYYPTNTTLGDGRTLTVAGTQFYQGVAFGGKNLSGRQFDWGLQNLRTNPVWFNNHNLEIDRCMNRNDPMLKREGHTAVNVPYGFGMVVFGGQTDAGYQNNAYCLKHGAVDADPAVNPTAPEVWFWCPLPIVIPVTGTPPAPRSRHTAIARMNAGVPEMIVFGGRDANGVINENTIWVLSFGPTSANWSQVTPTGAPPSPRYGHTAVLSPPIEGSAAQMIVYGGRDNTTMASSTVHALSLPEGGTPSWSTLSVGGAPPPAREGHCAVMDIANTSSLHHAAIQSVDIRKMVVFGGEGSVLTNAPRNDTWALTRSIAPDGTVSWDWEQITAAGAPSARTRHSGYFDSQWDRLVVFGGDLNGEAVFDGVTDADTYTLSLKYIQGQGYPAWQRWTAGTPPSARMGHTALEIDTPVEAMVPEIYDAAAPTGSKWTAIPSARIFQPYYPHMHLLPDGRVFYVSNANTHFLTLNLAANPPTGSWSLPPLDGKFAAYTSVQYRPNKIMKCGGPYADPGNRTASIDLTQPSPQWVELAPMDTARSFHNLTMLPNGQALMTGGNTVPGAEGAWVRTPRLWTPDASGGTWGGVLAPEPLTGSQDVRLGRRYHSTALLMPDGRVLVSGGRPSEHGATLYSPPYLFQGDAWATRPTISNVASNIGYGQTLRICTPNHNDIASVCLIRPGAVTHGNNMDQRYVPLTFTVSTGAACYVDATTPANGNAAPPGTYMLFLVNTAGVPSLARWVSLQPNTTIANVTCGTCGGGGGGCPVAEARTEGGWQLENTILRRSTSHELDWDRYRLKHVPTAQGKSYQVRIYENRNEHSVIDEVRLGFVQHPLGTIAFVRGDQLVVGRRVPAASVIWRGQDVTAMLDGTGSTFVGHPGDVLDVDLGPVTGKKYVSLLSQKKDPGEPIVSGPLASPASIDAEILAHTGILVQTPDGDDWKTVKRLYPRDRFDDTSVEPWESQRLRLVFIGEHELGFIGRVEVVQENVSSQWLDPIAARHTRFTNSFDDLRASDGRLTTLDAGDTLTLSFAAPPARRIAAPAGASPACCCYPSACSCHDACRLAAPSTEHTWFLFVNGTYFSTEAEGNGLAYLLNQNSPNPFTSNTQISFGLPRRERVKIAIYDLQGRWIRDLVDSEYASGSWMVEWDRKDAHGVLAPAAVYLYRMTAGSHREQRKMVLLP